MSIIFKIKQKTEKELQVGKPESRKFVYDVAFGDEFQYSFGVTRDCSVQNIMDGVFEKLAKAEKDIFMELGIARVTPKPKEDKDGGTE